MRSLIYNIRNTTTHMIEHILELIAPHDCLACKRPGTLLCSTCETKVPGAMYACYRCHKRLLGTRLCATCRTDSPLKNLYVATRYEGVAKELIQRLKFERAAAAAQPIARLMARSIEQNTDMIVVPVPTASRRIRIRGYDQSARIARSLAQRLQVPYAPLLIRLGQQRQVGSDRELRQKQMRHAFELYPRKQHEHKTILLVDDVITTGSTIEAAARALQQHGFSDIRASVFAAAE